MESGRLYALADQIRDRYIQNGREQGNCFPETAGAESNKGPEEAQEGTKLALSRHQVEILNKCYKDSTLLDLMAISGRSDRTKFRHQVLNPLLEMGLVEMTIPDKPRSSKQKYRITQKGQNIFSKMK
jgi:ATP-dependent DNA helicase RecG